LGFALGAERVFKGLRGKDAIVGMVALDLDTGAKGGQFERILGANSIATTQGNLMERKDVL
jgi:hypothetical protein